MHKIEKLGECPTRQPFPLALWAFNFSTEQIKKFRGMNVGVGL